MPAQPAPVITHQLGWLKGVQFAGCFLAEANGHLEALGVRAEFIPGGPATDYRGMVASGELAANTEGGEESAQGVDGPVGGEAGEAGECLGTRAKRAAEARQLREAARHQRRRGTRAERFDFAFDRPSHIASRL